MSGSAAHIAFALSYQISPIILTNGIATNIPGGMLPIIALSQSQGFEDGVLGGSRPSAGRRSSSGSSQNLTRP
jgi:hypothetical protein